MGIDIHGWVEVRRHYKGAIPPHDVQWHGVIAIYQIMQRNYDMFSCLFGIQPYAQFNPVAAGRGLPCDISEEASDDYLTWEEACGETWISWPEIQVIDWDEEALDRRPHEYSLDDSGQLLYTGKSAPLASDIVVEGNTWQIGENVFKAERIARRKALSHDWRLLFRLMETLAAEYGNDAVRLAVWFDR
ncbi:MAG: hypothetical protein M3Y13_09630 [Armatimonadota bacterium]|nr:hypothetical protein [Armatimonadota bacterium]